MTPDTFSPWYALWTRSRHEAVVREQLTRKGIEAFLPTVGKWSQWKDRRKKIDWPLFPGYCFARFKKDESLAVLTCMGVVTIVSFNGKPAPIAEEEVQGLRRVVETQMACDPCPLTSEGCVVQVVSGPLKGIVGRLVQKDAHHVAVMLGVELINQAVRVTVHAGDVRPM
jgi:transcription antitermination factor NusG